LHSYAKLHVVIKTTTDVNLVPFVVLIHIVCIFWKEIFPSRQLHVWGVGF